MTTKDMLSVAMICGFPEELYVASWSCDDIECITEQFLNKMCYYHEDYEIRIIIYVINGR